MPLTRFGAGVWAKTSATALPRIVRSLWMLTTAGRTRSTTSTTGVRRGLEGCALLGKRRKGRGQREKGQTPDERDLSARRSAVASFQDHGVPIRVQAAISWLAGKRTEGTVANGRTFFRPGFQRA